MSRSYITSCNHSTMAILLSSNHAILGKTLTDNMTMGDLFIH